MINYDIQLYLPDHNDYDVVCDLTYEEYDPHCSLPTNPLPRPDAALLGPPRHVDVELPVGTGMPLYRKAGQSFTERRGMQRHRRKKIYCEPGTSKPAPAQQSKITYCDKTGPPARCLTPAQQSQTFQDEPSRCM